MNQKQFILVLLALAIVGGAGLVLVERNQQTWASHEARVGDKVFPNLPVNSIASIHVRGVVDYNVVQTNGHWCVRERNDYPASFVRISDFLLKVKDLKVLQSDLIGPSQLRRLNLNEPGSGTNTATLFEFKDAHGAVLASMLVGKRHDKPQDPSEPVGMHGYYDGCYVLLPNDPDNVLLASDELAAAVPGPETWLNLDFFKIENINLISVMAPNPADSWELSRESSSSPWRLDNSNPGEVLNTNVSNDPGEILAFPSFEDVLPKSAANLASQRLDKPTIVTVMAGDLVYTLKVGPRDAGGSHAMTVSVAANIPEVRVAAPDESPEDKARLDAEFQKRTDALRASLERGRVLAAWIFKVDHWIEMVIHTRSELLLKNESASGQTASQ